MHLNFQARQDAIRKIADALCAEAQHRKGKPLEVWQLNEAKAVHGAVSKVAEAHQLRVPSLSEVQKAEATAVGHADYTNKWALYAFELTESPRPSAKRLIDVCEQLSRRKPTNARLMLEKAESELPPGPEHFNTDRLDYLHRRAAFGCIGLTGNLIDKMPFRVGDMADLIEAGIIAREKRPHTNNRYEADPLAPIRQLMTDWPAFGKVADELLNGETAREAQEMFERSMVFSKGSITLNTEAVHETLLGNACIAAAAELNRTGFCPERLYQQMREGEANTAASPRP